MTLYEGEVLEWNWIRSYGIAKITSVIGDNANLFHPRIGKEIFLTTFKSNETDTKLKKLTDEQKKELGVDFFEYPKLWFENGERIRFKITDKGLAYDIIKVELD